MKIVCKLEILKLKPKLNVYVYKIEQEEIKKKNKDIRNIVDELFIKLFVNLFNIS
jgi:hypothetical protein